MGNKRLSDTGPVHSPMSRHDAGGKEQNEQSKNSQPKAWWTTWRELWGIGREKKMSAWTDCFGCLHLVQLAVCFGQMSLTLPGFTGIRPPLEVNLGLCVSATGTPMTPTVPMASMPTPNVPATMPPTAPTYAWATGRSPCAYCSGFQCWTVPSHCALWCFQYSPTFGLAVYVGRSRRVVV